MNSLQSFPSFNQTLCFYNQNAQSYFKRTVVINMQPSYEIFLKHLVPGGNILDAGSGSGRDTKMFLDKGFRVTGMDASSEMVRLSSEYTNQTTLHLSFDQMVFQEEFDGVWCSASLLHIPPSMVIEVFKKIKDALKPNGIWFLSFMEGTFEGLIGDRYYHHMTKKTLSDYIRQTGGLEILELFVENSHEKDRPDRWLHAVVRKAERCCNGHT